MLTKKQLQLYNFIKNYIEENKISPSYDEMKNFLNLKSKSDIFRYLNSIEKLGYIRKINKKSRIVEIVKNRDEFFDLKKQLSSVISENKRLRLQNEKMKSALEKYASMEIYLDDSYDSFTGTHWSDGYIDKETGDVFTKLANDVLEEIEE